MKLAKSSRAKIVGARTLALWFGAAMLTGMLPQDGAKRATEPDGAKVFAVTCSSCHQLTGVGKDSTYPPLVGSEWVVGPEARLIRIILHGLTGEVEVQGESFSGLMPGWGATLKDDEIAAVATYVRQSWGNKAPAVTIANVTKVRATESLRKAPWTAKELFQILR